MFADWNDQVPRRQPYSWLNTDDIVPFAGDHDATRCLDCKLTQHSLTEEKRMEVSYQRHANQRCFIMSYLCPKCSPSKTKIRSHRTSTWTPLRALFRIIGTIGLTKDRIPTMRRVVGAEHWPFCQTRFAQDNKAMFSKFSGYCWVRWKDCVLKRIRTSYKQLALGEMIRICTSTCIERLTVSLHPIPCANIAFDQNWKAM